MTLQELFPLPTLPFVCSVYKPGKYGKSIPFTFLFYFYIIQNISKFMYP